MKIKIFVQVFVLFFVSFSLSYTAKFNFPREDGSNVIGYFNAPEGLEQYPIAIVCQSSDKRSILRLQREFAPALNSLGIALASIEKRGIYAPGDIDNAEYNENCCYEGRLNDHLELVESIENGLFPGWDGRFVLVGGCSEGGLIASAIAANTPATEAVVLCGTGGGLSYRDEMLKMSRWSWTSNSGWGCIRKLIVLLTIGDFEDRLDLACESPTTTEFLFENTHKWWASYLKKHGLDDILKIKCPVFYIHGVADDMVPIESADIVAKKFKELGRDDFSYLRLEGCGHNPRNFKKFNVFAAGMRWISDVLNGVTFPHKIEIKLPPDVSSKDKVFRSSKLCQEDIFGASFV